MNLIWSFEALSGLCMHKDPEVRKWAICRLSRLYPERTGDVAARLVHDEDASVVLRSLDHLLKYPPEVHRDTLLNAYKKSSGLLQEVSRISWRNSVTSA